MLLRDARCIPRVKLQVSSSIGIGLSICTCIGPAIAASDEVRLQSCLHWIQHDCNGVLTLRLTHAAERLVLYSMRLAAFVHPQGLRNCARWCSTDVPQCSTDQHIV